MSHELEKMMIGKQDEDSAELVSSINDEMQIVLLKTLKVGAILLKHARRGNPHYRTFWLQSDLSRFCWGDLKRKKVHGRIHTSHITEVAVGHSTKVFSKASKYSDAKKCFSLITKKRTLDLEAVSIEQRETWVLALKYLVQQYAENQEEPHSRSRNSKISRTSTPGAYTPSENEESLQQRVGTCNNLLDLTASLNERLELAETLEIPRLQQKAQQCRNRNKELYMNTMRKLLADQKIIDNLKYRVQQLQDKNLRLKQKISNTK